MTSGFSLILDGLTKEFKHDHKMYGTSPQNAYQETETRLEKIKDAADNLLDMISSLDRSTSNILGAFHLANLKYPDEMEHNKANILKHFMADEGDTNVYVI